MIGPTPGTVISRLHAASCSASTAISLDSPSMRSSSRRQSPANLDHPQHAGRENIAACRQDARQLGAQETDSLAHRDAAFQHEGADLIDDAGALTDQSLAHAVQRLQIELLSVLVATNLIVGRCTASAITSASLKSFFCPLLYGRTYLAGINRASWPSATRIVQAGAGATVVEVEGDHAIHRSRKP